MTEIKEKKVALVTGGARGIGRAICIALAKSDFSIVVNFNSSEKEANKTVDTIKGLNQEALALKADITNREEVKNLIKKIMDEFGRIDVLVNNAGLLDQKPFFNITDDEWKKILDINLNACFICTQEISKVISGDGSIVNISSIGGQFGGPKAPHYAAAKGALLTFTKSSARLLSEKGIRVNAIAPGFIRTEMYNHILSRPGSNEDDILSTIPLRKIGEPEDIGNAVSFLVSKKANYITGHTININGGVFME